MNVNLFVNLYVDREPKRLKELMTAFYMNLKNTRINNIIAVHQTDEEKGQFLQLAKLFNEDANPFGKVKFIKMEANPTYNDYFKLMDEYPQQVNMLANLDIFFMENDIDNLICHQWIHNKRIALALSRWDIKEDIPAINFSSVAHNFRNDSQDVWIFNGVVGHIHDADFGLGVTSADNKIAYCLSQSYQLYNPSIDIKSYHYHVSNVDNYHKEGITTRLTPPFFQIVPCRLVDVR